MATYNGPHNWDYWNVSLWLGNDEGLYNLALQAVRQHRNRTEAAEWFLDAVGETKTPDGARYTVPNVRAFMVDL